MKAVKIIFTTVVGLALVFSLMAVNLLHDATDNQSQWRSLIDEHEYSKVIENAALFRSRPDNRIASVFGIDTLTRANARLDFLSAEAAFRSGQLASSRKVYDRIISLNQNETYQSRAYFNRSYVELYQGKIPAALVSLKTALDIDPDFREAKHNLELLLLFLEKQKKKKAKGEPGPGNEGFELGDIIKEPWSKDQKEKKQSEEKKW